MRHALRRSALIFAIFALVSPLAWTSDLLGQSFRRGGTEFEASREIILPSEKSYPVVVIQFFHHGLITAEGKNVGVSADEHKLVPSRVLQLGPGDYCRLAFQTVPNEKKYELLYGGEPPAEQPPWTNDDGLLLETRKPEQCNLFAFESVRDAFRKAKPIGSDYVDQVFHSYNPFATAAASFMSYYSGTLHVGSGGKYGFFTSSQDASFLLIDGKVVVDAPGVHGPKHDTPPGTRKDITLSAGTHKFEYYHVATGPEARTSASWEISPGDPAKAKPTHIPPENFRAEKIGRGKVGPVSMKSAKMMPDYMIGITGDVPLPDNELALIGVKLADMSPKQITLKGKLAWNFGDGQTGEGSDPTHIYLHRGIYPITLSVRFSSKTYSITNHVYIDRPLVFNPKKDEKLPTLDDYLPILATYNPKTLDAVGLRQLVLAYQWKMDTLLAVPEEAVNIVEETAETAEAAKKKADAEAARKAEAIKYARLLVEAGKTPFLEDEAAAQGDDDLFPLVQIIGPMARDYLGDAPLAGKIWLGASKKVAARDRKAECLLEAADVLINDMVKPEAAKEYLAEATKLIGADAIGVMAGKLKRVMGDFYAAQGKGEEARKAYRVANENLLGGKNEIERTAWMGAHSRSTEQFLKTGDLPRAAMEIRAWVNSYPAEKIEGLVTLNYATYLAAREKYAAVAGMCDQLQTVNKDSPYIDQMLILTARCEAKRGELDRAKAVLHSLVKDYPGSPLIPDAKERLKRLEDGESFDPDDKGSKKPRGGKK